MSNFSCLQSHTNSDEIHVLQLRVKIQVENLMHFEKKVKSFDRFEISGNLENIKFVLKIVNQSTY